MSSHLDAYAADLRRRKRDVREELEALNRLVEPIRREAVEEAGFGDFTPGFISRWENLFFQKWAGLIAAPPVSESDASAFWVVLEQQMLAGSDLGLEPGHAAAAIDSARKLRLAVSLVVRVLPAAGFALFESYTHEDAKLHDLRQNAPVTSAAAWRFVVELARCRESGDPSLDGELSRLTAQINSPSNAWWQGFVWSARRWLGGEERRILAQARAEKRVNREDAARSTKSMLYDLRFLLDAERRTVEQIQS